MQCTRCAQRAGIIIAIFALFASLACAGFASRGLLTPHDPSPQGAIAHWQERIRAIGAPSAYEEMIASAVDESTVAQHLAAHAFGGALYRQTGAAGFSICTSTYGDGCMHEFMGEAVAARGVAAVSELARTCDALAHDQYACWHGIGHGLVANFGYRAEDLGRSLEICHSSVGGDGTAPCTDGTFMEYDLRRMAGSDADPNAIRPFAFAERFSPCDRVGNEDRASCMRDRPWWWYQSALDAVRDTADFFQTMGLYCRELKAGSDVQSCFQGIGFAAAFAARLDPANVPPYCAAATDTASDETLCKIHAGLRIMHEERLTAAQVCGALSLSAADSDRCFTLARQNP